MTNFNSFKDCLFKIGYYQNDIRYFLKNLDDDICFGEFDTIITEVVVPHLQGSPSFCLFEVDEEGQLLERFIDFKNLSSQPDTLRQLAQLLKFHLQVRSFIKFLQDCNYTDTLNAYIDISCGPSMYSYLMNKVKLNSSDSSEINIVPRNSFTTRSMSF